MPIRRLYLLWSLASTISIGIGIVFYLIAMKITYGNFSGHEDFDGLVYALEALILTIFATGIALSLLVLIDKRGNEKAKHLAKWLFAFYSIFALFCLLTLNFAIVWLNPLSFIVFAIIPKLARDTTLSRSSLKKGTWFLIGIILTLVMFGGLEFLDTVLSDPYR
jgi:hypothetical protein